jgi:hypothetical protein
MRTTIYALWPWKGRRSTGTLRMCHRPAPTIEPATLPLHLAAAYCGLSVETFKAVCPVKPIEFTKSSRGHRWLRVKLDAWLASLDPNGATSPAVKRLEDYFHGGQGAP